MLVLKSPKPAQVLDVFVSEGAHVQAGQLLLRLDDDEEQRALSKYKKSLANLETRLLTYTVAEEEARARALSELVEALFNKVRHSEDELKAIRREALIGAHTILDISGGIVKVKRSKQELIAVMAEKNVLNRNYDAARRVIALLERQVAEEIAYVERQLKRLSISAPVAGHVSLNVGVHSLVKLAGALCIIE